MKEKDVDKTAPINEADKSEKTGDDLQKNAENKKNNRFYAFLDQTKNEHIVCAIIVLLLISFIVVGATKNREEKLESLKGLYTSFDHEYAHDKGIDTDLIIREKLGEPFEDNGYYLIKIELRSEWIGIGSCFWFSTLKKWSYLSGGGFSPPGYFLLDDFYKNIESTKPVNDRVGIYVKDLYKIEKNIFYSTKGDLVYRR